MDICRTHRRAGARETGRAVRLGMPLDKRSTNECDGTGAVTELERIDFLPSLATYHIPNEI